MPTILNNVTDEYKAIFGDKDFTPLSPIEMSSDYNCGGIANELEYCRSFLDYITRTNLIDNLYSDYLERVVGFFTGLKRTALETDASLILRFKVLCQRQLNTSWITKWMIRDVFKYFFDESIIYVIENYINDEYMTDGDFENSSVLWTITEPGATTIDLVNHDHFIGNYCMEFVVDADGSLAQLKQETASTLPIGYYQFSFFVNDDFELIQNDLLKVYVQRKDDNYYYNFSTWQWQADVTYWTVQKTTESRYQIRQAYIDNQTVDNLIITFENIGDTDIAHTFWVDNVQLGTQLEYPSVKVLLINEGPQVDFMSAFPGTTDPVPGVDYDFASFYGQCFLSGIGGAGTLIYYQNLLNILKPTGVSAVVVVEERISEV